ncbi:MAG TPA: S-methyl-5'-thioadenosine phosphorylase [Thermodesulfovibrionales bacterium]|nr:S-methyl-5'-thioadenosine phosphorylase [Thermodesulfovibrionales bacterium]
MPKIGVVGGSGLYNIPGLTIKEYREIITPFGDPSDTYMIGEFSNREVAFLPRHGLKHHIPPHKINYKANMWGFKELGVERIISIGAVGGIGPEIRPGMIIVPDQIIDMTKGRDSTYYDGDEVVHIDFTEPYCPELRESVFRAGRKSGVELIKSGTYACVNGPRLETRAEIKIFLDIGIDMVGMTAMPEAALARELELCLAGVAVVTNYAAGITKKRLTTTEVIKTMGGAANRVGNLLEKTFNLIPDERRCACKGALKEARM